MLGPPTDPSAGGNCNINKLLSLVVMVSFIVLCYTGTLFESKAMKQWGLSVPATEKAPSVSASTKHSIVWQCSFVSCCQHSRLIHYSKVETRLRSTCSHGLLLLWLSSFDQSQNRSVNFLCEEQVNKATSFLVLCSWSVTRLKNALGREQRKWCELFVSLSCVSMAFLYQVADQLQRTYYG